MKKNLFRLSIKEFLVPTIIIAALMVFISGSFMFGKNDFTGIYVNPAYLFTIAGIGALFFPIIVYSFRFSLKKADIYYQGPYKQTTVVRIKFITGLVMLLLAYTAGFTSHILCQGLRYGFINISGGASAFLAEIGSFGLGLLFLSFIYINTSFVVSKTTSLFNAILLVIAVNLFLTFAAVVFESVFEMFYIIVRREVLGLYYGRSIEHIGFSLYNYNIVLDNLVNSYQSSYVSKWTLESLAINTIGGAIISSGCLVGVLIQKNPSGEKCGKAKPSGWAIALFHMSMSIYTVLISSLGSSIMPLIIFTFFLIGLFFYYLLTLLFSRTKKMHFSNYICLGANSLSGLFILLMAMLLFGSGW